MKRCASKKGFTLTETLIALALIGVIGAMTIPKLLTSQGQVVGEASVREAFVTVGELCLRRAHEPDKTLYPDLDWGVNVASQMETYLETKLNVRRCAPAEGCEFEFQSGVRVNSITEAAGQLVITFDAGGSIGTFQLVMSPNASTINAATYPEGYATRYITGSGAATNARVNQILNVR